MAITGGTAEWQSLSTQAIGTENTLVLLKHDLELDMSRRHSPSGRDERRLARPTLRGRPQPPPLDARGDGGGGTWLGSRRCHRARALLFLGRRHVTHYLQLRAHGVDKIEREN